MVGEDVRVLVIGLDGATPDLLMKWAEEGKLPTFADFIKNGVSGRLRSTIPPVTCPAWLSFTTGKNPAKLGVFDFIERKKGTYKVGVVNFQAMPSKFIWEILGKKGKKVGVFNVPTTFPPREVNGFIVCGWPIAQGASYTYPENLQSQLNLQVGEPESFERTIMMATWRWFSGEEEYLKGLYRVTERELKITKHLMENNDWDFFMTVFSCIDPLQHFFWKYIDQEHPLYNREGAHRYGKEILEFHQRIDEIMKQLLRTVDDDTTVIVMSDHGFGALHNVFNVNTWLNKRGFLQLKKKGRGFSSLSRLLPKKERILGILIKAAQSFGMLRIYYFVTDRSSLLRNFLKGVRSFVETMPASYRSLDEVDIDWSKTKAYSFGAVNIAGKVYINLRGREPEGIVEPGEEYEELRDLLIEELKNLVDPETHVKMDVEVFKREEIYNGDYLDEAPDIVFFMNGLKTGMDSRFSDGGFFYDISKRHDNGGHRLDGILMMRGAGIRKGAEFKQARIIDVAPTILYLLGCPIPSDMDGKVLKEALEAYYLRSNPIKYEKAKEMAKSSTYKWSKEEEERIEKRLRALGYT